MRTAALLEGSTSAQERRESRRPEGAKDPGSRDRWVGGVSGRAASGLLGLAAAAPPLHVRVALVPGLAGGHGPPQSQRAPGLREDVQAGPECPAHGGNALPEGVGGEHGG